MTPSEAFMAGVSMALAEAQVSPVELVTAVEKIAKGKPKEDDGADEKDDSFGIPLPGAGVAKTLGLGALGVTTLGSLAGGRALGQGAQGALASDLPTSRDLRKEFLIKKLEDLVRARKARLQNHRVQAAMQ